MGSWDQTCALTQLPIGAGDRVVGFVVERTYDIDMACGTSYPTDLWAPASLPLFGEYDSYGRIQGIDDATFSARHLVAFINEEFGLIEDGRITSADGAIYFIDNYSREHNDWKLGYVLFHEQIWRDMILSVGSGENRYGKGSVLSHIESELTNSNRPFEMNSDGMRSLSQRPIGLFSVDTADPVDVLLGSGPSIYSLARTDENVRMAILDLYLTNVLLIRSRRMWIPQSGQGSQDGSLREHRRIARAILDHIDRECARRKAEGWWYDEDEDA